MSTRTEAQAVLDLIAQRETLRTQLAEAVALLRDCHRWILTLPDELVGGSIMPEKIESTLARIDGEGGV